VADASVRTPRGRKRRRSDDAVLLLCGCSAVSCAASPRLPAPAPVTARSVATTLGDSTTEMVRYHSKRLALSLPLPDGPAWVVDDRSRGELVATHAATRSTVVVTVIRTDDVVGRDQCEAIARSRGLLPEEPLQTVEDAVVVTQGTFDTRIRVALQPGGGPDRSLTGYVTAFGGFLRKCYVFAFSTGVAHAYDEAALSSRLAFARTRILPGLELDPLDAIVPMKPTAPDAARPR
jgi:hypothetical protein